MPRTTDALFAWATASSKGTTTYETIIRIPTIEERRLGILVARMPDPGTKFEDFTKSLMSCDCPGWTMQKRDANGNKKPRDCQHISGKDDRRRHVQGYVAAAMGYLRMHLAGQVIPPFRNVTQPLNVNTEPTPPVVDSAPSLDPTLGFRHRRAVNFD